MSSRGHDAMDARKFFRCAGVDRLDAAVRDGAAKDFAMQHARQAHGVGIFGATGDLVARLEARQRAADLSAACGAVSHRDSRSRFDAVNTQPRQGTAWGKTDPSTSMPRHASSTTPPRSPHALRPRPRSARKNRMRGLQENSSQSPFPQISGKTGVGLAVVLVECRIGIDVAMIALAQYELGMRDLSDSLRKSAPGVP